MNILLDTNILINLAKDKNSRDTTKAINPNNQKLLASVVTISEIKSLALQNNWGVQKLQSLDDILDDIIVVDINEGMVNTYAQIDAFSQCRNPSYSNYPFLTPRNMGKNDLWIATTAALLGLTLLTTDADFNHLHNVFIEVQLIKPDFFRI